MAVIAFDRAEIPSNDPFRKISARAGPVDRRSRALLEFPEPGGEALERDRQIAGARAACSPRICGA